MMIPLLVAAWRTGFVLENVRLKVEAFDYLQLPFNIKEGVVGRIQVQARSADDFLHLHVSGARNHTQTRNLTIPSIVGINQ